MATPSKNQYTGKLKSWGVGKYHPGSDWAIVHSTKRKRSQEGKDSDVYIRKRKLTQGEVEKEIARHVPLGREWCSSENVLPEYITVCTPQTEPTGPPGMCRDFLLRDLPWYQCTQEIQTLVSGALRRSIVPSTPGTPLELAMRELAPQSDSNLPQLRVISYFPFEVKNDLNTYLPPEDLAIRNSSTRKPRTLRDKSPLSILKIFLQRFIFLSANNLLNQWQFNKVCDWIVEKGGVDILVFLCRLGSPSMEVFAGKVFCSAVVSGNICLGRRVFQCGTHLQTDDPSQRQRWTEYLSKAVYHGHEAMVELLCKAGVHPEVKNRWSWQDDWDLRLPILHILLAFGADPERFITKEGTGFPLINAALNGSLGAVELLLNKGARIDLYLPRYYGTALQAAASRGHLEVAKYLIQHGAEIDVPHIPQIQLSHGFTLDFDTEIIAVLTPVQIAAKMNNMGLLQMLLQHGASAMACPASAYPDIERYFSGQASEHWIRPWGYKPQYNSKRLVYTALQYGVINQNLKTSALLLSAGAAPDSQLAPGVDDTPLQMSTRLGNVEMFQLLWSWGADFNAPPAAYNGRTAIQGAAESGNWEILSMLRCAGAQINALAGAEQGMTALQAACLNGHSLIAGVLLAHGADLNTGPSSVAGLTPIQAAAAHGDIGLVRDLITLGVEVNAPATEAGTTALLAATEHKSLPLLELLVQHGADVNAAGEYGFRSPLREAASQGWLEGVQLLLEHGANVNDTPFDLAMSDESEEYAPEELLSPLGWAITRASEEMIDLLLQHGAEVLATSISDLGDCQSALMHALCRGSSVGIIDLLLAEVPDLEKHPGWENALKFVLVNPIDVDIIACQRILEKVNLLPPLLRHKAIRRAWNALPTTYVGLDPEEETLLETIELLINLGAPLDSRDEDGSTLVLRAARCGCDKSCSFLISRGAAVNTHAAEFWGTPLQEAIKRTNVNLANILLEHGADINALPAEDRGITALQAASINGMFELAVRLLERGADVSAPAAPRNGRTAINGAAERGHFDMVQLLLNAYGPYEDLESVRRQAAGYAEKEDHFEVARWLRGYSAS
ncbi:ankyrin repeat-containing domain protein [Aspergillus cavernicola]|uniref:Ankyrin repeat-containing domain protein n=1 Tax=Aspergillus cavernicola TaxID=176166 RepID=A0ABR4I3C2_9EURO